MPRSPFSLRRVRDVAALLREQRPRQLLNAIRFKYHELRGFPAVHLPYGPVRLMCFLTTRCNLRCRHCQYGSPESRRPAQQFRDMSIDALARILNLFPRALSVCFSGSGEPLLHPEFFEMIRLVHQRRKKVHVFTNGTLLAGRIGRLLEAPVRFLNVSLYGIDGESFNQLTGAPAGLLGETVDAVTELARRRRPGGYPQILRANIICTKDTMHNAVAGIRLCEQIGVDQVKLKNLTCHEVTGYDETVCLHEDDPEVKEFIRGLRRERFRIPVFLPRLYRKDDKARQCSVPFYALSVDGDGSTAPCFVAGTDKKWGNVLEQPGLWNGPVMVEARRNLLDLSQPLARTCRHCEHMIRERTYVGG